MIRRGSPRTASGWVDARAPLGPHVDRDRAVRGDRRRTRVNDRRPRRRHVSPLRGRRTDCRIRPRPSAVPDLSLPWWRAAPPRPARPPWRVPLRCRTPRSTPSPPTTTRPALPPLSRRSFLVLTGAAAAVAASATSATAQGRDRPGRRARPPARRPRRRTPRRRRVPAVRHRCLPGTQHRPPAAPELRGRARSVQHRVRVRQRPGRHRAAGRRPQQRRADRARHRRRSRLRPGP